MSKGTRYGKNKTQVEIYPQITGGNVIGVTIIGTPDGLRYLARLLEDLAARDQNDNDAPRGSREHLHLHPGYQLGDHSCEVEISRADGKGTGELPAFMK